RRTRLRRPPASVLGLASLFGSRQKFLYRGQDTFHDLGYPRRIGMHAVSLIEGRLGGHAFKEEGIEDDLMLLGQLREETIEVCRIVGAHVARGEHTGEERWNVPFLQALEQLVQIVPRFRRVDAAQGRS